MKRSGTLLVSLHHAISFDGSFYEMKEVWWQYLRDAVVPLFERVDLVCPVVTKPADGDFRFGRITNPRVTVVQTPGRAGLLGRLAIVRQLWNATKRADYAWVFLPSVRGIVVAAFCRVLGVPYIVYVGGEWNPLGGRVQQFIVIRSELLAVRHSSLCLAAGAALEAKFREVQPATYRAAQATAARALLNSPAREWSYQVGAPVRLIYVGTDTPNKQLRVIGGALGSLVNDLGIDATLDVVGPCDSSDAVGWLRQFAIEEKVRFHGYVPSGEALWRLYREADVFVLASLNEGFPRVLYEAALNGCAIVTTPVGGVPDVLRDGVEALHVRRGSSEDIATAVIRLCEDVTSTREMVGAARSAVVSVLCDEPAEQVSRLYIRCVKSSLPPVALVTNLPAAYRHDLLNSLEASTRYRFSSFFTRVRGRDRRKSIAGHGLTTEHAYARSSNIVVELVRFFSTVRPTCIIAGGAGPATLVSLVYSRLTRIPLVLWWGGTGHSEAGIGSVSGAIRRLVFKRVACVLAYGDEAAEYAQALGATHDTVRVLGNASLDVEAFRARVDEYRARITGDHPQIVFISIGRLTPSKNLEALTDAYARLHRDYPHTRLRVVVDGVAAYDPEQLRKCHPLVEVIEGVRWEDMPRVLADADVYVHPSLQDRWPQSVNEAMAAGLPVIVTRQSGLRGFVSDGENGLVVDGRSEEELLDAMRRLVVDAALRLRLGEAAHNSVKTLGSRTIRQRIERALDVVLPAADERETQ